MNRGGEPGNGYKVERVHTSNVSIGGAASCVI